MTAVNFFITPDRKYAFCASDTLMYDAEKRPMGFAAKTLTFPHAQCAMMVRGRVELASAAHGIVGLWSSFDEVQAKFPDEMKDLVQEYEPLRSDGEVILVGWSHSARGMASQVVTITEGNVTVNSGNVWLAPMPSAEELASAGLMRDGKLVAGDPGAFLFKAMQVQRASYADTWPIGGHCVLTVVTEHTITQRVIHRWPDEIGKPTSSAAAA